MHAVILLMAIWPFNHLQAKERAAVRQKEPVTRLGTISCAKGYKLWEAVPQRSFGPPQATWRALQETSVPDYGSRGRSFACFRKDLKTAPR